MPIENPTSGSSPGGVAGGSLAGTYPNPSIAAGAVDSSALASNVLSRQAILWDQLGWVSVSAYIAAAISSPGALASQYLFGVPLGFAKGDIVTNICCQVTTAGSGTAPTSILLGLYDSTGNQLGITAELNSDTAWTSVGWKELPLGTPYTFTADGFAYAIIWKNGTFGTTDLAVAYGNGGANGVNQSPSGDYPWLGKSGVVSVGATITLGNDGSGRGYCLAAS